MLKFLLIAIALLNIITVVVYGIDKLLSKRKGKGHKYANMQVYVGDRNARNFGNRTTPLPHLEEDGCALWNSLTQIDEKRVIAVMSVKGMGKNGIWTAIGEIVKR